MGFGTAKRKAWRQVLIIRNLEDDIDRFSRPRNLKLDQSELHASQIPPYPKNPTKIDDEFSCVLQGWGGAGGGLGARAGAINQPINAINH